MINSAHALTLKLEEHIGRAAGVSSLVPDRMVSDSGEISSFNTDDPAQIPEVKSVKSFELRCGQSKRVKAVQQRG